MFFLSVGPLSYTHLSRHRSLVGATDEKSAPDSATVRLRCFGRRKLDVDVLQR